MTRKSSRSLGIVAFDSLPAGTPDGGPNEPRCESPQAVLCRMRNRSAMPPSEAVPPTSAGSSSGRATTEVLDADLRQLLDDLYAEVGRLTSEVYRLGKSFRPR
jgi:hypothetical protein